MAVPQTPDEAREALRVAEAQLVQVEQLLALSPGDTAVLQLRDAAAEAFELSKEVLNACLGRVSAPSPPLPLSSSSPPPPPPPPLPTVLDAAAGALFGVGSHIEVLEGAQWLPAWIHAVGGESDTFVVRMFGSGKEKTVGMSSVRRLATLPDGVSRDIAAGDACLAIYAADGKAYDAVVVEVTAHGYKVKYTGYDDVEEVPYEYLRQQPGASSSTAVPAAAAAAAASATSGGVKRPHPSALPIPAAVLDDEGNFKVPENLQPRPGDTEAIRESKRRKIRALKSRVKLRQKEEESVQKQSSWQSFASGKGAKPARGSVKGLRKESIFKSPESVDGRVGVTGSGQGVTQFQSRSKVAK